MRTRVVSFVLTAACVAGVLGLTPTQASSRCTGDGTPISTASILEGRSGLYALPSARAKSLVVFAHGYGNSSESWRVHLESAARDHGAIAVAMDYTGLGPAPDYRGWPARLGARDLRDAALFFLKSCPGIRKTAILGISMGGNMSGLAVAEAAKRSGGRPLFDYWVDVEGATNLSETFLEATAVSPVNAFAARAAEDIRKENGGTLWEKPDEYRRRTIVLRAADIAASAVRGVTVVHGVDDGLVPFNQGREMAAALAAVGVPTDMFNVVRRAADENDPEGHQQTTLSTNVTGPVWSALGLGQYPTAGHGWEGNPDHPVIKVGFDRLWAILGGAAPGPYREFVVDDGAIIPAP